MWECDSTTPNRSLVHHHNSSKHAQDRHVHRCAWNCRPSCFCCETKKSIWTGVCTQETKRDQKRFFGLVTRPVRRAFHGCLRIYRAWACMQHESLCCCLQIEVVRTYLYIPPDLVLCGYTKNKDHQPVYQPYHWWRPCCSKKFTHTLTPPVRSHSLWTNC